MLTFYFYTIMTTRSWQSARMANCTTMTWISRNSSVSFTSIRKGSSIFILKTSWLIPHRTTPSRPSAEIPYLKLIPGLNRDISWKRGTPLASSLIPWLLMRRAGLLLVQKLERSDFIIKLETMPTANIHPLAIRYSTLRAQKMADGSWPHSRNSWSSCQPKPKMNKAFMTRKSLLSSDFLLSNSP